MSDRPEFSRPIRLDGIGDAPRSISISADPDERMALARRFDLPAIDRLNAELMCVCDGEVVTVSGTLTASVHQLCVATAEPLASEIDESFALRFVPEKSESPTDEEIELEAGSLDEIPYSGSAIDIGEAVAETLLLALDPFPRSPDADARLKAACVKSEEDVGPFSALGGLRDLLAARP